MAKVNPKQKSAANKRKAWFIVCKENGQVISGHCTCKAGYVCMHGRPVLCCNNFFIVG